MPHLHADPDPEETTGGETTETEDETPLRRTWYCELSEKNIDYVARMIRARLDGKTFAIASSSAVNRPDPRLELRTGCRFEPDWTDGSTEAVRMMSDDNGKWLAFSAGHYFWMFHPREKTPTCFSFDYDGIEVSFYAPCGDMHRHFFRAEGKD